MIAFASLFLGLMFGVRPVEIVVADEAVAAIELILDGEQIGVLHEPPWRMECHFGSEIEPHRLEAVARDASGREIDRIEQWINLPKPKAVLSAVLEPRQAGEPWIARLSWESSAGAEPESVTATVDGQPIAIDDPRRLVLPPVDPAQLHLLSVEMKFAGRVTSSLDLTFGGTYAEEVSTEITALPIWATGKSPRPPRVAEVQGWFVKNGEPLKVIAIDRGLAEAVVVMARPFPHFTDPGQVYKPKKTLRLADDHRLRFVSPIPKESQGVATTFELFPISQSFDGGLGDLYEMLSRLMRPARDREPHLGMAVAVAGLAAYEGRQRRAVVLIPSASRDGADGITASHARRYLEHLRVPFYVWYPENKISPALDAWGDVRSTGSIKSLGAAYAELADDLDRQWIVWLDGQHLPQDIELAKKIEGFRLAH